MHFALADLAPAERYRLLAGTITPRPIAWITTRNAAGVRNLAPYSFFALMSANPATVAIGIGRRADGSLKDSSANILATGEFVIHLVSEDLAPAMNVSAIDAPPDIDEIALTRLATVPSVAVIPPRLADAPVALECRLAQSVDLGATTVVLGEVLHVHIADRFIDPARMHVDTPAMHLVGRMHGAGWYCRTGDLFKLDRPVWDGAGG